MATWATPQLLALRPVGRQTSTVVLFVPGVNQCGRAVVAGSRSVALIRVRRVRVTERDRAAEVARRLVRIRGRLDELRTRPGAGVGDASASELVAPDASAADRRRAQAEAHHARAVIEVRRALE